MSIRRYGGKEPARERGSPNDSVLGRDGGKERSRKGEQREVGGHAAPASPPAWGSAPLVDPPRSFKPSGPFHLVVLLFDLVGLYIQRLVVRPV